jgi:hypothetical protein
VALDRAKKMKTLRLEPNKAKLSADDESESRRAIITVLLLLLVWRLTCVTHTQGGLKRQQQPWLRVSECVCIGIRQVTQMKIIPLHSHARHGIRYVHACAESEKPQLKF